MDMNRCYGISIIVKTRGLNIGFEPKFIGFYLTSKVQNKSGFIKAKTEVKMFYAYGN